MFSHLRHTWSVFVSPSDWLVYADGYSNFQLNFRTFCDLSTNQLKPIVSWSRVYYSRSYWLLVMLTLVPIGHCDFSGFGFKTPNTNSFVVTKQKTITWRQDVTTFRWKFYLSSAFIFSRTASLYMISCANCSSHSPLANLFRCSLTLAISWSFSFNVSFKLAISSSLFFNSDFAPSRSCSRLLMLSWALHSCCLKS